MKKLAPDPPYALGDLDAHEAEVEERRDQIVVERAGLVHGGGAGRDALPGEVEHGVAEEALLFGELGQARGGTRGTSGCGERGSGLRRGPGSAADSWRSGGRASTARGNFAPPRGPVSATLPGRCPSRPSTLRASSSDLNAEVRAAAYLPTPGWSPCCRARPRASRRQPMSGSGGKVTNISLDGTDGVALLSRDVAVVRASDDAVWALLDITHTPKMDQVGARRAVALPCAPAARRRSPSAGTGARASSASPATRSWRAPSRSAAPLRAVDVGETETYAVVDGADGGQLRVHPGATPEPGASLRCNLPSEAASLRSRPRLPPARGAVQAGHRRRSASRPAGPRGSPPRWCSSPRSRRTWA